MGRKRYHRFSIPPLLLVPTLLLLTACGTLEVGIEPAATPAEAAPPTAEGLGAEHALVIPAPKTPTPVPDDYVAPTPEPAFTPMPVEAYPAPAALRVAYLKDGDVWLWTAEGRRALPLTSSSGIHTLRISDDGQIIAFRRDGALWMVNSDGAGERQLLGADDFEAMESDGLEGGLHRFEWVPGTHILAFNTRLRLEAGDVPADDLRLINADTLEQTVLLPPGEGGEFHYSPDGGQIAIVTTGDISLIDADGANRRDSVLTYAPVAMYYDESGYYVRPTWAADSESLMVAIPPADPHAQPTGPTTIWHIPTDGTPASLITSINALPIEDAIAFSHELNYVAYAELQWSATASTEEAQIELKVVRLENGDWFSYRDVSTLYGWAPNSRRFAFVSGRQMPQFQICEWSGPTIQWSIDAGTSVDDLRWVDADHHLVLVRHNGEMGAEGDSWDLVLGDVDGSSTVLASGDDFLGYDFSTLSDRVEPPAHSPARSMKGWELYSWQMEGEWYFALVVGTNRIKTFDQVASAEVRVQGLEALTAKLAQLARGEQVFWLKDRVPNTTLPPEETIDEVAAWCAHRGIQLEVVR